MQETKRIGVLRVTNSPSLKKAKGEEREEKKKREREREKERI